jgi:hypothetical protein
VLGFLEDHGFFRFGLEIEVNLEVWVGFREVGG